MKRLTLALGATALVALGAYHAATRHNLNPAHQVGDKLDEFNGVAVYYNGGVNTTRGRALTADGYNLGLMYQCVEFVKRYYHQRFGHKMPDAMGHAKDFFSPQVADGAMNPARHLLQYRNGASTGPAPEDLIVFAPWVLNPYGHVAIVSEVGPDHIEVVQQNPGPFGSSRERYALEINDGVPRVAHSRVLGWLRRAPSTAPGGIASAASAPERPAPAR